ncbi:MAG TPA: hypothetical protein VNW28_07055 [Chthoniobacterales bacterium]|nr:hypothetical protein [Chthoniobacterales bacterium]
MDNEPNEEISNHASQQVTEPIKEPPLLKLRDLRPEKDPIGAGRRRFPNAGAKRP